VRYGRDGPVSQVRVCQSAPVQILWRLWRVPRPGVASFSPLADFSAPPQPLTPTYLSEKILISKTALEGERKQVTVLFADLKGSMELLAHRDPEEACQLLDPVLERMMAAMHHSEGNANPFAGDSAAGCSNPWGGSGYGRELDGPWCTGG
jgi:hypothetical protein